jgi:hypothetical protein
MYIFFPQQMNRYISYLWLRKKNPTLTVHLGPGMYGESWSIFIFELFFILNREKKYFHSLERMRFFLLYYMAKKDKEKEEEKIDHQFSSVTHRQQVRALNWNFFFF